MIAEKAETVPATPTTDRKHHLAFFRDSGWLMIANVAAGAMMWGVHFFSKVIPEKEYAVFGTLLALAMCIPVAPLQLFITQQTAAALATGRQRQLAGMFRIAWLSVTVLWLIGAGAILMMQNQLIERWDIVNPAALWVTLLVLLATAWLPLFLGLLQGKQDFMPFGWVMIVNGVGRVGACAFIVLVLAGHAAGIMTGTLIGLLAALALGVWHSRGLWLGATEQFDWRSLIGQAIPLLVGFGACQFLMAADTMIVKAFIKEDSQCYVAAGTLSRALVWAVGPMTAVLFPRIVQSSVRSEKNNLFGLTLVCTAALAIIGALALWVLGPWIVRFVSKESYVEVTTQLLPWYAGAMIPLCITNLLVSNLLGKKDFRVVVPAVLLAVAYGVTLMLVHGSFVQVLQLLGGFNLALLAVCAWFTFRPGVATKT